MLIFSGYKAFSAPFLQLLFNLPQMSRSHMYSGGETTLYIVTLVSLYLSILHVYNSLETSVYKGYKRDKIEMRVDRVEVSDFPLYLNTVAGGLDRRDQTIGGFSFVVKIYAVPVVEIIGQLLYLLGRYGFNTQFGDCL